MKDSAGEMRFQVPLVSIVPFLLITFGLAWGILALFIFFQDPMRSLFGELTGHHPLFFLAVYAPAIAGVIVVLCFSGFEGLRRFLSRLLLWRCSFYWSAFLFLGIPLVYFGSAWGKGSLSTNVFGEFQSWKSIGMALALTAIKGPVEELGWRGVALPLIQRKFAPVWAGLILGLVWGFWHLPAFLLSGTPQCAWSFAPFFAGSVAVSVIVTPLFNKTHGSILLPALFHFQLNNPLWPDAQPYDMLGFVVIACFVVWLNRGDLFSRASAVREVIPEAGSSKPIYEPDHTASN